MSMSARQYTITGYVQGVGYRWHTMRHARSLGLTGWVRNLGDGSVEVWAEGPDEELKALEILLKNGPSGSRVREVKTTTAIITGRYTSFNVTV